MIFCGFQIHNILSHASVDWFGILFEITKHTNLWSNIARYAHCRMKNCLRTPWTKVKQEQQQTKITKFSKETYLDLCTMMWIFVMQPNLPLQKHIWWIYQYWKISIHNNITHFWLHQSDKLAACYQTKIVYYTMNREHITATKKNDTQIPSLICALPKWLTNLWFTMVWFSFQLIIIYKNNSDIAR